jgi:hypothetical protein
MDAQVDEELIEAAKSGTDSNSTQRDGGISTEMGSK